MPWVSEDLPEIPANTLYPVLIQTFPGSLNMKGWKFSTIENGGNQSLRVTRRTSLEPAFFDNSYLSRPKD